jgi:hypothetical protein
LVAPLAGDGGVLLRRAIALARPSYIFLAVPQGVGELGDNAAVVEFARSIGLSPSIRVVEVPNKLVDAVIAVRRSMISSVMVLDGFHPRVYLLRVYFALFDNAPNWLNTVLLYTASVVRSLIWEGIGLGGVVYYHVDEAEYLILKIIAEGRTTAEEIHETYVKEVVPVSRQLIDATLARLNQYRLVNMIGSGEPPLSTNRPR